VSELSASSPIDRHGQSPANRIADICLAIFSRQAGSVVAPHGGVPDETGRSGDGRRNASLGRDGSRGFGGRPGIQTRRPNIEGTIAAFAQPGSGLIVLPDSLAVTHRQRIIELAARHGLPAVYPSISFTTDGGLISYGINWAETYRQAASYVDRILRGARPAELPVQAPTKLELIVNVRAARSIGIAVPPSLLNRADDVIE
jgi:hypothetical protein